MRGRKALVFAMGSAALLLLALAAYGGWDKVWCFAWMDQHRSTARMMLAGTLRLHRGLTLITNDEQVYGGAGYTNWGYGVPLLELPFHWLALHLRAFRGGFFPDRAIFFLYLGGLVPLLWSSLARAMSGEKPEARWARRAACSFAAACLVLTCALFPLMAYRFFVYEETVSYLVVSQLYALCAYIHTLRSDRLLPTCALALAAGLGLLIRATGLIYFAVWLALVLLERRSRARIVAFAATAAPLVAFWLCSNTVRSGSPFSFGYANSVPWLEYHIPIQRFGSQCADTLGHAADVATSLFAGFFFVLREGATPYLRACHFTFELQDPAQSPFRDEPFFGVGVFVFLAWTLLHHLWRRERRLAVYLPYVAFGFLFLNFVHAGIGFAWRYTGDFWPLIVLVAVQYVHGLPAHTRHAVFGWATALLMLGLGAIGFAEHVVPELPSIRTLDADSDAVREMPGRFELALQGVDPVFPSHVRCRDLIPWPYDGGTGWDAECGVDTFTNVYLGVPQKPGAHYELRLRTTGMEAASLRVYVNGRFTTARRDGDVYRADVEIDYARLTTPTVMATVEWTRGFEPPAGRLLSIELG